MGRTLVYLAVFGALVLTMMDTKPTTVDYLDELQRRADAVAALEQDAFAQMRGTHPLDEMVARQSPVQLMKKTRYDDFYVFSIFTTDYETPRAGLRSVRTFGLFSKMVSFKAN